MSISEDWMLHEIGYRFTGPPSIASLTRHEIQEFKRHRFRLSKTKKDMDSEWKEQQLIKLKEQNYENGKKEPSGS